MKVNGQTWLEKKEQSKFSLRKDIYFMIIKDFNTFLNEKMSGLHKVICAVSSDLSDFIYVTGDAHTAYTRQFMTLFTKGVDSYAAKLPVVNYCNIHMQRMIKAGTPQELIYNKEEAKNRIASKVNWHKIHKDSLHVAKTVVSADEIDQLKFPIIAKPENRFSGQGIVKFETLKDAQNADLSDFTIFNEMIDIAEEHRIPTWRGEPLMWFKRIPANEKTKKIEKEKDEKLRFNYLLKKVEDMPQEWKDVIDTFAEKHKDLDIYSVDLAIDSDGKPWVIEMSSEFAPIYGVMALIYKKVYQDYYGKPLSKEDEAQIDMYHQKDIEATVKSDRERFTLEK